MLATAAILAYGPTTVRVGCVPTERHALGHLAVRLIDGVSEVLHAFAIDTRGGHHVARVDNAAGNSEGLDALGHHRLVDTAFGAITVGSVIEEILLHPRSHFGQRYRCLDDLGASHIVAIARNGDGGQDCHYGDHDHEFHQRKTKSVSSCANAAHTHASAVFSTRARPLFARTILIAL